MFEIGIFTKIGIYSSFNGQCIQLIYIVIWTKNQDGMKHGEQRIGWTGVMAGAVATHCSICGGQLP
jgi:hypothetical protein